MDYVKWKNINIKLKKISYVIRIGHKKAEPGSNIFLMWSINSGLLLKRNRICAKIWKTFNSGAWRVQRLESAKYTERGVKHRSCLTWLMGEGWQWHRKGVQLSDNNISKTWCVTRNDYKDEKGRMDSMFCYFVSLLKESGMLSGAWLFQMHSSYSSISGSLLEPCSVLQQDLLGIHIHFQFWEALPPWFKI